MELAPNRMDTVKVGYNRKLRHLPKPNLAGDDFFAIISPRRSEVMALIKKDSMTSRDIDRAMSSLGFWNDEQPIANPLGDLLNDLEALKQLPDDTAASYIKGQLSESLERYFAKRN